MSWFPPGLCTGALNVAWARHQRLVLNSCSSWECATSSQLNCSSLEGSEAEIFVLFLSISLSKLKPLRLKTVEPNTLVRPLFNESLYMVAKFTQQARSQGEGKDLAILAQHWTAGLQNGALPRKGAAADAPAARDPGLQHHSIRKSWIIGFIPTISQIEYPMVYWTSKVLQVILWFSSTSMFIHQLQLLSMISHLVFHASPGRQFIWQNLVLFSWKSSGSASVSRPPASLAFRFWDQQLAHLVHGNPSRGCRWCRTGAPVRICQVDL